MDQDIYCGANRCADICAYVYPDILMRCTLGYSEGKNGLVTTFTDGSGALLDIYLAKH